MSSGLRQTQAVGEAPPRPSARPTSGRPAAGAPTAVTTAVVIAAAAAEGGGAAAAQPWEDGTLLGRLLGQLDSLGVPEVVVLTRPEFVAALEPSIGGSARLQPVADLAATLRAVEAIARDGDGGIVVLAGEVLTQREALAGLLVDPRVATGVLASSGAAGRPYAFRLRSRRGRIVSAASPYHIVSRPTASFLGVLKVAATDRDALAAVAARLAELVDRGVPGDWQDELARKAGMWRVTVHNTAARRAAEERGETLPEPDPDAPPVDPAALELDSADQAELDLRVAAAPNDTTALLLTGIVRAGTHVGLSHLRRLFWARPLSTPALARASERILEHDEDKVLLDSAVKANDGFFTTFFVSPYSKYIARWAAHRGLTPNQVTTASVLIGVLAALAFATGERWGLVTGAILLQIAFTTDCVDGQLARYSRQFSKLGAWLDSVFDRTKEYVVYAGLAIGAEHASGLRQAWLLAGAALTLQCVRHMFDFSYASAQHQVIGAAAQPPLAQPSDSLNPKKVEPVQPERDETEMEAEVPDVPPPTLPLRKRAPKAALRVWHAFDRLPAVFWIKKMIAFPIGERFAAISITAALFTPRTTFIVLLAWGGVAAVYTLAGRVLRSIAA